MFSSLCCICQAKPVAHCRNEAGFAPRGTAGHRHPGFEDTQTRPPCTAVSPRLTGTSLEPPLLLQMRQQSVPASSVGQEPSPHQQQRLTWGFSLEDAQHLLLLGQPTEVPWLQDLTLCTSQRHQAFVLHAHKQTSSLSSLHVVQAAPAGRKTTTCTEQTKNSTFF